MENKVIRSTSKNSLFPVRGCLNFFIFGRPEKKFTEFRQFLELILIS